MYECVDKNLDLIPGSASNTYGVFLYHVEANCNLSTIKDWDLLHQRHFCVVFARLLCSAGITNQNEFHTSSSPTLCASNDVTSGHAHSLCSEIWFSEPTRRRQMAKYGNLKHCESQSFSGDIESLEPSKF